jgi:tetratricopeptide (TPR) repeat protein
MPGSSSATLNKRAKDGKKPGKNNPVSVSAGGSSSLFSLDRETLTLCLGLAVAICAFYSPIVHNQFLNYDDKQYITDNPPVKQGLTWATIKWAFVTDTEANWHPLTWLSHELDSELFGLSPVGPHCVNVLFHIANSILLFLLLQYTTGFRWRSLMVAVLFALHPINVESVAWAAERKNVLSMLFFLLALYAYVAYTRQPEWRRYALVAGLYALALMAKPQVITFPCVLWLWDYWPLERFGSVGRSSRDVRGASRGQASQRQLKRLILEKIPLLLLSAVSAIATMKAQTSGFAVKTFEQYSPLLRLETALLCYVRYIARIFWPHNLVAMYPHATDLYPAWQVAGALLVLLAITVGSLLLRERRYLIVGWLWFLGTLVPMIGLVQVGDQAMADRYEYLPAIGLFLMIVWGLADLAAARKLSPRDSSWQWVAVPAVACLLLLGVLTYSQISYWHDSESFWNRTLALTKDNYFAEGALAGYLRSQGRTEEAMAHYRQALAIHPGNLISIYNLGAYEHSKGNLQGAIERYQFVVDHAGSPRFRSKAYANLGFAYRQLGQPDKAREAFGNSLQLLPDQPPIMVALGVLDEAAGDLAGASHEYFQVVAKQPSDVAYLLLAHALQQLGRPDEAKAAFQRAARMSKNLPMAEKQAESLLAHGPGATPMTAD